MAATRRAAGTASSNDADWARPSASHRRSMSTFSRWERLRGISRPRAAATSPYVVTKPAGTRQMTS